MPNSKVAQASAAVQHIKTVQIAENTAARNVREIPATLAATRPIRARRILITGSCDECAAGWNAMRRGWAVTKAMHWVGRGKTYRAAIELTRK